MMDISPEIEIKANLFAEGLMIEESALRGVGTKYKEDVYSIADYGSVKLRPGALYPGELKLPLGTVCMVRVNTRSPYLVKREDGTLILEKNGKFVTTLEWIKRPKYYDQLTSDGTEMKRVVQACGECMLMVGISDYCLNWEGGNQCRYCNLFRPRYTAREVYKDSKQFYHPQKLAERVGETVATAVREGRYLHGIIVGGMLPGTEASDITVKILERVREYSGLRDFPWTVNNAPPPKLSEIDRMFEAGVKFIGFNLEVWDKNMFKVICPGKEKNIGRDAYERALEYSVPIFGRGNVMSVFVLGLEEKEKYFEAAAHLAERGIFLNTNPWIPVAGSKLEGHRAPYPEWTLEVNERIVDIMAQYMPEILTEGYFRSGMTGCYQCQSFALWWDEIRRRLTRMEIGVGKDTNL